jgi:hypothetical protein
VAERPLEILADIEVLRKRGYSAEIIIQKTGLSPKYVKDMEHPLATSHWLVEKTGLTAATVNKSLANLEQLDIVRELTAQKRNRLFSYHGYVEIMNRGTELPER